MIELFTFYLNESLHFARFENDCLLNLFLKTSIDLLIRKKYSARFIHFRQRCGKTEENREISLS